jgi:hypothetical protein
MLLCSDGNWPNIIFLCYDLQLEEHYLLGFGELQNLISQRHDGQYEIAFWPVYCRKPILSCPGCRIWTIQTFSKLHNWINELASRVNTKEDFDRAQLDGFIVILPIFLQKERKSYFLGCSWIMHNNGIVCFTLLSGCEMFHEKFNVCNKYFLPYILKLGLV